MCMGAESDNGNSVLKDTINPARTSNLGTQGFHACIKNFWVRTRGAQDILQMV